MLWMWIWSEHSRIRMPLSCSPPPPPPRPTRTKSFDLTVIEWHVYNTLYILCGVWVVYRLIYSLLLSHACNQRTRCEWTNTVFRTSLFLFIGARDGYEVAKESQNWRKIYSNILLDNLIIIIWAHIWVNGKQSIIENRYRFENLKFNNLPIESAECTQTIECIK